MHDLGPYSTPASVGLWAPSTPRDDLRASFTWGRTYGDCYSSPVVGICAGGQYIPVQLVPPRVVISEIMPTMFNPQYLNTMAILECSAGAGVW